MDYRIKFRNLRIDNDLTQQDIANLCNVSDATVGHWENQIRDMKIDHIVQRANIIASAQIIFWGFQITKTMHGKVPISLFCRLELLMVPSKSLLLPLWCQQPMQCFFCDFN